MLYYITALIAEFGQLEAAASNDSVLKKTLQGITKSDLPLADYLFDLYLTFSSVAASQEIAILCLAALFRANPQLILRPKSEAWMRGIFSSNNEDSRAWLLNLLRDFLKSEAVRRAKSRSFALVVADVGRCWYKGRQRPHWQRQRPPRIWYLYRSRPAEH